MWGDTMQEFSTGRYPDFIVCNGASISGMRGIARRLNFKIRGGLRSLPSLKYQSLFRISTAALISRHEVAIMYAGRASEALQMTSERMAIPSGRYTLGQLLCSLYKRGDHWVDELDDSHLVCTVDGRKATLFDPIEAGAEIRICS